MKRLTFISGVFSVSMGIGLANAQNADVSLPKQRELVVDLAVKLTEDRAAPLEIPDPLPNPFKWPEEPKPIVDPSIVESKPEPVIDGLELLAKLAAQIQVSGTINLGSQPLLLMGQKRLKVGDRITISFEEKSYDLSLEAIAPTSFTVRRGDLTFTRATRISSSSPRP